MAVPLAFQCKTCRKFFEWTEEFRKPDTGASCCSNCLANWNAKKSSRLAGRKRTTQARRLQVIEQKRLFRERAEAQSMEAQNTKLPELEKSS